MVDLSRLVAELAAGDDSDNLRAVDLKRVVAEEPGRVDNLLQGFEGAGLEQRALVGGTGNLAMLLHLRPEPIPVEGEVVLRGHRLEQFGRKAVGLVHLARFRPGDDAPSRRLHLVEDPLDSRQPSVDRFQETRLFRLDDLGHAFGRVAQLGVGNSH